MVFLEDDIVGLMKTRVIEEAGCLGMTIKVVLNGSHVHVKSFCD